MTSSCRAGWILLEYTARQKRLSRSVWTPLDRFRNFRMFHLDITAGQSRGEILSKAAVVELLDLSATVKKVVLKIEDSAFSFKAGQWVDFHIPDEKVVGGFSICSAPKLLKDKRLIELAVKRSKHPPVAWIHDKCKIGSEVSVRAGGDFFYDPKPEDSPVDLLLLAGGVGVNPIRSIFIHEKNLAEEFNEKNKGYRPGSAELLYSAKTLEELLFKEDFLTAAKAETFNCTLFASQSQHPSYFGSACIQPGRISHFDIMSKIDGEATPLRKEKLLCFICGPKGMVNSFVPTLKNCKIEEKNIIYEAWTVSPPKLLPLKN